MQTLLVLILDPFDPREHRMTQETILVNNGIVQIKVLGQEVTYGYMKIQYPQCLHNPRGYR